MPDFLDAEQFTLTAICTRMHEHNRDRIQTRKSHLAIAKLEAIVAATLQLSKETGFSSMTLRQLSQKSGVSIGSMYTYFSNKEGLLEMILQEVFDCVDRFLLNDPEGQALPPLARLHWFLSRHVELTEHMSDWFVFAYMEARHFPAQMKLQALENERKTESYLRDILIEGCTIKDFHCADPKLLAALAKPMLQDWYIKRGKYARRQVSQAQFVEAIEQIILDASMRPRNQFVSA